MSAIDVLPLEEPVDRHYGEIRSELEGSGQPIGFNDLLIAAHARALGLTLVTNNVGEFRRVSGLSVEDWLELPRFRGRFVFRDSSSLSVGLFEVDG